MGNEYGAFWEMLEKKLDNMEDSISSIKTDVAVIKDKQSGLITSIEKVKITLYGNGHPGLVTGVALMRQKVVLISAVIGGLFSFLGALIIGIVKGK